MTSHDYYRVSCDSSRSQESYWQSENSLQKAEFSTSARRHRVMIHALWITLAAGAAGYEVFRDVSSGDSKKAPQPTLVKSEPPTVASTQLDVGPSTEKAEKPVSSSSGPPSTQAAVSAETVVGRKDEAPSALHAAPAVPAPAAADLPSANQAPTSRPSALAVPTVEVPSRELANKYSSEGKHDRAARMFLALYDASDVSPFDKQLVGSVVEALHRAGKEGPIVELRALPEKSSKHYLVLSCYSAFEQDWKTALSFAQPLVDANPRDERAWSLYIFCAGAADNEERFRWGCRRCCEILQPGIVKDQLEMLDQIPFDQISPKLRLIGKTMPL